MGEGKAALITEEARWSVNEGWGKSSSAEKGHYAFVAAIEGGGSEIAVELGGI